MKHEQATTTLLRILIESGLEFVVIGGVAAYLHGSSHPTEDLDIAAPFDIENMRRLAVALKPHDWRHALVPGRPPIDMTPEELAMLKNLYIQTDLGRVDVLGEIPPIESFDRLRAKAVKITYLGHECRVVHLDDLIEMKTALARPQDQLVVQQLRALHDRNKGQQS